MWVLDHLDDLDADFRVFYRIDGVGDEQFGTLTAPRFLALAYRTTAYNGAMAARVAAEDRDDESAPQGGAEGAQRVSADRAALAADPVFSELIDF